MKKYLAIASIVLFAACSGGSDKPVVDESLTPAWSKLPTPSTLTYKVEKVYPHDPGSFTQGLQIYNGKLYEGTGDYNNSAVKIVNLETGVAEKVHKIGKNDADSTFGEGITILKDKLYQLTWKEKIVYVYDVKDITKPIKQFNWISEGWGITNDGTNLIISDGVTSNLYFVDPETFKVQRTQAVESNQGPTMNLNELEYIDGFVYANIWETDDIVKIDPASGHVVGKLNLAGLLKQYAAKEIEAKPADVLNGIAYDSTTKKIYITGKWWPKLFEITIN
jgi:glutaminyl-peptide cyclotransferase